jgi:lysophospholipase L1-like esterase
MHISLVIPAAAAVAIACLTMGCAAGRLGDKSVAKTSPASKPAAQACSPKPSPAMPVKGAYKASDWIPSWDGCHEYYCSLAKKGGLDLVFMGDSLTWGWTQNRDVWNRGRGVWDRHYGKLKAAQFGIIGDTTQNLLYRIGDGELDGISPKVVVLLIGANNLDAWPAQDIADGVGTVVKAIRQKAPATKVLLLGIFPLHREVTPTRQKIKDVNAIISKIADGDMVRFLDIGDKFVSSDGTELDGLYQPDGCHLEKDGYEMWASSIEPTLMAMMGAHPDKSATKRKK